MHHGSQGKGVTADEEALIFGRPLCSCISSSIYSCASVLALHVLMLASGTAGFSRGRHPIEEMLALLLAPLISTAPGSRHARAPAHHRHAAPAAGGNQSTRWPLLASRQRVLAHRRHLQQGGRLLRPDMADFLVAVCRQQADYTAGCNDAGTARFLSSTYTGSSSARRHGRWHCQICIAG